MHVGACEVPHCCSALTATADDAGEAYQHLAESTQVNILLALSTRLLLLELLAAS